MLVSTIVITNIFLCNLLLVVEDKLPIFLSLLFLLSGFLWTVATMYAHEASSYDSLTCESILRWKNENSHSKKDIEKTIAQMHYWKSISFRMHAIFYKLATMILLVYTILLLFLFFFPFPILPTIFQASIFCILSIIAAAVILYLLNKYKELKFGCLLRKLMEISDRFHLLSTKNLTSWPDFWNIVRENRQWLVYASFVSEEKERFRTLEKFVVEFEMFYKKPIITLDASVVEKMEFQDLKYLNDLAKKQKKELKMPEIIRRDFLDLEDKRSGELREEIKSIETIPDFFEFSTRKTSIPYVFPSEEDKKRFKEILYTIHGIKLEDLCNMKTGDSERIWSNVTIFEYSVRASASCLVTDDEGNVRKRKNEIEEKFGIRIRSLDEMINELEGISLRKILRRSAGFFMKFPLLNLFPR